MDYHVWSAMLEFYRKRKTKPETFAELKEALQVIRGNLPQGTIDRQGCERLLKLSDWRLVLELKAGGEHFIHIHSVNRILASN